MYQFLFTKEHVIVQEAGYRKQVTTTSGLSSTLEMIHKSQAFLPRVITLNLSG